MYCCTRRTFCGLCVLSKTDEPIEMPSEVLNRVGSENRVLDEVAHWRRLANITERSVLGGDAAMSNYFDRLFSVAAHSIRVGVLLLRVTMGRVLRHS